MRFNVKVLPVFHIVVQGWVLTFKYYRYRIFWVFDQYCEFFSLYHIFVLLRLRGHPLCYLCYLWWCRTAGYPGAGWAAVPAGCQPALWGLPPSPPRRWDRHQCSLRYTQLKVAHLVAHQTWLLGQSSRVRIRHVPQWSWCTARSMILMHCWIIV